MPYGSSMGSSGGVVVIGRRGRRRRVPFLGFVSVNTVACSCMNICKSVPVVAGIVLGDENQFLQTEMQKFVKRKTKKMRSKFQSYEYRTGTQRRRPTHLPWSLQQTFDYLVRQLTLRASASSNSQQSWTGYLFDSIAVESP